MTLLEVVVATFVLALACIFFGSAMIATSDAEAKAARHTQSIMIGNYLLETMRRDGEFWDTQSSNPGDWEWVGSSCSYPSNCWTHNAQTDPNNSPYPAYDDDLNATPLPWHTGFPFVSSGATPQPYYYVWRADPIDQNQFSGDFGVASLEVELYLASDPTDIYVVRGLNREQ
ncbi:MAG TPA: hypothetical protein VEJ20_01875 [Candidatus Eremiobacteraceae bacterium]|nr:hypothetical protein [Candidatus Eremiobacteraceae bacterium]